MKKMYAFMPLMALLMMTSLIYSCQSEREVPTVGILTAYYASEDFKAEGNEYKKGQLICDSNDPLNRIVEGDVDNYKYEGDDGGELYSWLLPKSKVEKKTYTMNQLTASDIGEKAYFVAENGCVARIFWSNDNGHRFFNWNGEEEKYREEERYKECFVLSVEYMRPYDNSKCLFEEQLAEKQGSIELYCENRYTDEGAGPDDCRYREGLIGFIEESWNNKDGWGYDRTAYDEDGKLLVDQWEIDGISDYISVAYITDMNALYVNGQLYYRNSDENINIPGLTGEGMAEDVNEDPISNESDEGSDSPYSQYVGEWTYYIETQGQRLKCYGAVINNDMTCGFITYTPDGDRNVIKLKQCVFSDGYVYLTDNGDITLKGTPRFKLGPDGLLDDNGNYMVKE